MQESYKIVFEVAQNQSPDVTSALTVGGMLLIAGLIPFTIKTFSPRPVLIGIQITLLALGAFLIAGPTITKLRFREFVNAYRTGRCDVVEGVVENFKPMPPSYHGLESFTIGGKRFEYSDFRNTPGFHHSRLAGGPICAGLVVRIYYLGSDIARLEIAE